MTTTELGVLGYLQRAAATWPDKTAVACEADALTFAQLDETARYYAALIAERGLQGAGEPIGVYANRGVECIVGFMAVLYSGNFYLALDPDLPEHKLSLILEDSAAPLCLGAKGLEVAGPLDIEIEAAAKQGPGMQAPQVAPRAPLCLIYTSGSTGKPKGVLKSHGAMCAFIEAFIAEFGLGSNEVIGNQTPFFFDASAKDLYLMLAAGCTMEIIPATKFVLPVTLIEYLNERKITYACWVPTAFAIVTQLNTFKAIMPTTLRRVLFVGEVFPIKQLAKWIEALPQLEYVNLYGSTETAGICCYHRIDTSHPLPDPLPLGKPLPMCNVTLVGEDGTPITQPGVIGEICISSPTLADCYFNDPEKTAERFSGEGAERVLHTGDLARYDEDGNLVFASRSDYQIKLQGRRIELGEIEAVADSLDCIQRCACVFDEAKKKIVLFAELVEGSTDNQKSIRAAMRERTSDYMVPGKVVILDTLPYNANGKISRPALQELL